MRTNSSGVTFSAVPMTWSSSFQFHLAFFPKPDSFSSVKPEWFSPQLIAIGPFHHSLNALILMKTFQAQRIHRGRLQALAPEIRACYDKHLTVTDDILVWIMCINGPFLIELLTNDGNIFNFKSSSSTDRRRMPLDKSEMGKIEISVLVYIINGVG
ncbi:unnamed protein product [Linum trigynum]